MALALTLRQALQCSHVKIPRHKSFDEMQGQLGIDRIVASLALFLTSGLRAFVPIARGHVLANAIVNCAAVIDADGWHQQGIEELLLVVAADDQGIEPRSMNVSLQSVHCPMNVVEALFDRFVGDKLRSIFRRSRKQVPICAGIAFAVIETAVEVELPESPLPVTQLAGQHHAVG